MYQNPIMLRLSPFLRFLPTCFALACVLGAAPLQAAIQEGVDYRNIEPPQRTSTAGKIEVLEFFSYGCPHCNEFYPMISAWAARLPKDVEFKRVATGLGRQAWTNFAKLYYALEYTGDLQRLDAEIFHALHEEHQMLNDEASIADWVARQGLDRARFVSAYESFGVATKVSQAEQMLEDHKVEGVPGLTVDGKYVVLGTNFAELLEHTDALIAKVRAERAPSATHK